MDSGTTTGHSKLGRDLRHMMLNVEQKGDVTIIAPDGILGDSELPILDDEMGRKDRHRIVLDLSRATYINSQGVSLILRAWRRCQRESGRFVLVRPRGAIREVLDATKIDTYVSVADTLAEATALVSLPLESPSAPKSKDSR